MIKAVHEVQPDVPDSSAERAPRVGLVMLNNSGVGGTERRFAQVYQGLKSRDYPISLVVNESLLEALVRARVLGTPGPDIVLKEPMGRLVRVCLTWMRVVPHDPPNGLMRPGKRVVQRIVMSVSFGLRKLDYALSCVRVGWWLIRQRPNVLHLALGGAYVVLPLQMLGWTPPTVVSVVGPKLSEMVGSVLGLPLYRLALKWAHVVDALTESIHDGLVREGVPKERIRVPGGSCVNASRFCPAGAKKPWVVFAGRLLSEKNPLLFVRSCVLVHERVPAARFFVLGDGPLKHEVTALVRKYGLESYFPMVGWHDQVEAIMAESLVFVSLQRTDNYPSQALLEGMSCGMAVVATDVGLTRKLVEESVGILVEPEPSCVADAVVRLLDNPGQAAEMGQCGRARVVRHHSIEAYLDYLERIYASLSQQGVAI